jgi:hypothetical protein
MAMSRHQLTDRTKKILKEQEYDDSLLDGDFPNLNGRAVSPAVKKL